jgi:hypothetical protein
MRKQRKPEIWSELLNMEAKKVKLEQIYLDPNNPRLETPGKIKVPDQRITEDSVQDHYSQQLQKEGITDLTKSIETSGFWTVDRVVLRPLDSDKYVVVEGNRRIVALKILRGSHETGKTTLRPKIYEGILEFESLVYKGKNPEIAWIIQGLRHTPGIKSWEHRGNKYPKAKFISNLVTETGKSIAEIASILGMTNSEVTELIRSYYAFEQARKDEEFGDEITPEKFGYFDQIILKIGSLKKWLGWKESKRRFTNAENLRKFLFWIVTGKIDKISRPVAKTLTKLFQSEYKDLLLQFEQDEDMDIYQCEEEIYKSERERVPIDIVDIIKDLERMKKTVTTLPIPQLKLAESEKEKTQREQLYKLLEKLLKILKIQIENLRKT